MKKGLAKTKLLTIVILIAALVIISCVTTFALIISNSTRGKISGTTIDIDATATFSLLSSSTSITFDGAKSTDSIKVNLTNSTQGVLHYYYQLTYTDSSDLSKAVLVSHNGTFQKALNRFTAQNNTIEDEYAFVGIDGTATDTIEFELHEAIKDSLLDQKSLTVTLEVYTESINHQNYMFVSTEQEYKSAIDDVNSGQLTSPTIVLLSDLSLTTTYTLQGNCTLVLGTHSISGTTVLDSPTAFMRIVGDDASKVSAFTLTLTDYDTASASLALAETIKEKLNNGINGNSSIMDLSGTMVAYKSLIEKVGSNYDYLTNDTLTAFSVTGIEVETIKVGDQEIEFDIYSPTTNIDTYLSHIPTEDEIITTDLYLPTSIQSLNATIDWTSADLSLMDNQGNITTNSADVVPMTYYATIKVNNTVYTKTFTFKLSVYNNEINFNNGLSEISPVVIYASYNGSNSDEAYYYLPIVDETSTYDYRKKYSSPSVNPTYTWSGHRDILLTDLEYSLILDDTGAEVYDYIGLDGNAVYLKGDTLNTYAQINVKGTFNTGDYYTSAVNINIAVGTKTEILEPAFKNVQEYLTDVDVLYSILSSRIKSGIAKEEASITLPGSFKDGTDEDSNTFTIEYSASSDVIKSITKVTSSTSGTDTTSYKITLDPTKFSKTETSVPLSVKVIYTADIVKERTVYFTVPAVLKTSDVGNATLFNSLKYQVISNLPQEEKNFDTGFTTSSSKITNKTADYILIRDIVGDDKYTTDYITGYDATTGYLSKLGKDDTKKAKPVSTLTFSITDKTSASSSTDGKAYDLARLIEWATSSKNTTKVSDLGLNNSSFVSTYGNTTSDGHEYLTTDEIAVLKAYYNGASGTSKWDDVWKLVSEKAPGYVFSSTTTLDAAIKETCTNYATKNPEELYFKYVEVLQVVLEKKDHVETGYYFPNMGVIGASSEYGKGWASSGKGIDDGTVYISEEELGAIKVFWTNALTNGNYVSSTTNASTYQNLIKNALDASVTWPEYFIGGGISKLINYFYEDANIQVGTDAGFVVSQVNVPAITNLDSLNAIFNYFPSLTTLQVVGTADLSAFLETQTLSSFFNRLTIETPSLQTITLRYCADNYTEMDISGIKEFDSLQVIDLSHNSGLTDTAYLVNVNSGNYTSVNFSDIGTEYEFLEYTISSLSSSTCAVVYTNTSGDTVTTQKIYTTDKTLTYLNEFNSLIAENMFLADKIYTDTASSTNVYWRIDEGNKITTVTDAGKYSEISSVHEMNMMISPYYYCSEGFTYSLGGSSITFEKGNIYKIIMSGSSIEVQNIGITAESVSNMDEDTLKNKITSDDIINNYEQIPVEETMPITSTTQTYGDQTVSSSSTVYTASTSTYTIKFNCFRLYYNYYSYRSYYLYTSSASALALSRNYSTSDESLICFLTEAEKTKLVGDSFTSDDVINNAITLGSTSFPSSTSLGGGTAYYVYFPYRGVFLSISKSTDSTTTYTLSSSPTDTCRVYINSSLYYIYSGTETETTASKIKFLKRSSNSAVSVSTSASSYGLTLSSSSSTSYTSSNSASIMNSNSFILYDASGNQIESRSDIEEFGYDTITTTRTTTSIETYITDTFAYEDLKWLYCDGNVYQVMYFYEDFAERFRESYYTETLTTYRFYYKETSSSTKTIIERYDVGSYYWANGTNSSTNNVSSQVSDKSATTVGEWTMTYDDGNSTFDYATWNNSFINSRQNQYDSTKLFVTSSVYVSHINETSSSSTIEERKTLMEKVNSGNYNSNYYLYSGTTGSENVNKEDTNPTATSYTKGYGYTLSIGTDNTLTWNDQGALTQNTATTTMDSILTTANSVITNKNYSSIGLYYGMYYAYTGNTVMTSLGNTYQQNTIYRLTLNDQNQFVYEEYKTFATKTLARSLLYDGIVLGGVTEKNVGDVYYITTTADTYSVGYYKLTYDQDSNAFGLMKFTDIDYDATALKLLNRRIYSTNNNYLDQNDSNENYGGTGGSFDVVITAFTVDGSGNISTRKFRVTVTG